MYGKQIDYKIGTVLFVRGQSSISKLIKKFDGEFSHCCLCLNDVQIIESQRFSKSQIILNPYVNEDCEAIHFNLTERQKIILNRLSIRFCGYGYDYGRLVGFAMEKMFGFDRRNFLDNKYNFLCCELVEMILAGTGVIPIDSTFGDKTLIQLYDHLRQYGISIH